MSWMFCWNKFDSDDDDDESFLSISSISSFSFDFIDVFEKEFNESDEKWYFENDDNDCEFFNFWIRLFEFSFVSIFFETDFEKLFVCIDLFTKIELLKFDEKLFFRTDFDLIESSFSLFFLWEWFFEFRFFGLWFFDFWFFDFVFWFGSFFRNSIEFFMKKIDKYFNEKWLDIIEWKKIKKIEKKMIVLKKSSKFSDENAKQTWRFFFKTTIRRVVNE